MTIVSSQLVKSGCGEQSKAFSIGNIAFKTSGMPREYLGGETMRKMDEQEVLITIDLFEYRE